MDSEQLENDTPTVQRKESEHGIVETFANDFERDIVNALKLVPNTEFSPLADLKNLRNESTGYVHVYSGGVVDKAAFLSINMMPGMRYFNVHIIPHCHLNIPRFSFEGMLTSRGSQVSLDLYPDFDVMLNLDYFRTNYQNIDKAYNDARFAQDGLALEASRLLHMRAFASPYLMLAYNIQAESLPLMASYAREYLSDWLKICENHDQLTEQETSERESRRKLIMQSIIDSDPDRDKVVMVYGEELTQQIERATML